MSAFSSLDTGQPVFALATSSLNFAWSAPGTLALRERWTAVMAKPSATCSSVTAALVSMCSAVSFASPSISDNAIVKHPANQLLGIGARLALEATAEAIGILFERTALCRDGALTVFGPALPAGGSMPCQFHRSFSLRCRLKLAVTFRPGLLQLGQLTLQLLESLYCDVC